MTSKPTAQEIVAEYDTEELLNAMDYSKIVDYITQVEMDKTEEDYDRHK